MFVDIVLNLYWAIMTLQRETIQIVNTTYTIYISTAQTLPCIIRLKVKAAVTPVTAPDSALRRHSLHRSFKPGLVRGVDDD